MAHAPDTGHCRQINTPSSTVRIPLNNDQPQPAAGWSWSLFSGIVTVLLGVLIWRQWPVSGAWAIGILVGIHVLMSGWAAIMLGAAARGAASEIRT